MFRIDSEGATVDNKFTEGDPSLGVPATVVSADWLNATQEEIAKFIEYMGIALLKANDNQLQAALLEFYLRGGRQSPLNIAIANNTADIDVTGFTFDSATVKAKIGFFTVDRKTDAADLQESGFIFSTYDSKNDTWNIAAMSSHNDSGLTWGYYLIGGAGTVSQLKVSTSNMAGASYVGNLNITSIIEIR